jgi:hypothetical protein
MVRYTKAVLRSYVETKLARGKTRGEASMKLEILEVQVSCPLNWSSWACSRPPKGEGELQASFYWEPTKLTSSSLNSCTSSMPCGPNWAYRPPESSRPSATRRPRPRRSPPAHPRHSDASSPPSPPRRSHTIPSSASIPIRTPDRPSCDRAWLGQREKGKRTPHLRRMRVKIQSPSRLGCCKHGLRRRVLRGWTGR